MSSLAYKTVFSEEALRLLEKMDNREVKHILTRLEAAANDPPHYFSRLSGRAEYKLRAGDYRVLVNLDPGAKTVLVRSLGHRKNVYERR